MDERLNFHRNERRIKKEEKMQYQDRIKSDGRNQDDETKGDGGMGTMQEDEEDVQIQLNSR